MTPVELIIPMFKKAFSIGKKVFLVFFVFAAIIVLFSRAISKDRPKMNNDLVKKNRTEIYKILKEPEYAQSKTGKISAFLFRAVSCTFIGEACTDNPADGDKYYKDSVFGKMAKLIVIPYANPPASGIYWVKANLEESGFIPKSYAAEGIGFASLKPIMNLWMVFRDVAYLLLVLVLVAIGFMIMFRMKINPQTVISAENALPKIVTSLILITFSFAIAGFLVDVMYILVVVGISLITTNSPLNPVDVQNKYMGGNVGTIFDSLFPIKNMNPFDQLLYAGDAIMGLLPWQLNSIVRWVTGGALLLAMFTKVIEAGQQSGLAKFLDNVNILGTGLGSIPNPIIQFVVILVVYLIIGPLLLVHGAGLILGILIFFTIVFLMFRIFFLLFRSYLTILLMIIFSPLVLLLEAVPGKSSFSGWLKTMFAELLSFPLVALILTLGNVMANTLSYPGDFWTPPFLTGIDPNAWAVILGLGIMFLIPDIIKLSKDMLGVKPLPLNVGPGTFFAGAGAAMGGATGMLSQFGSIKLGLGAFGLGTGTGFMGLKKAGGGLTASDIGKEVAAALKPPTVKQETGDSSTGGG